MILIDSNVIIDLLGSGGEWQVWSQNAIVDAGADEQLAVTPIVVAEVAPRVESLDGFIERIERFGASIVELSNEAAYAAGTAFNLYRERRRNGDERALSIIADFLIGGQALVLDAAIITRDARFYRSYFPTVTLITPDKAEP